MVSDKALMLRGGLHLAKEANNKFSVFSKSLADVDSQMENNENMIRQMNEQQSAKNSELDSKLDRNASKLDRNYQATQKANRMLEIENEKKQIERDVKETIFQLDQHMKIIDKHELAINRFILYKATASNIANSHLKSECLDKIEDKKFCERKPL